MKFTAKELEYLSRISGWSIDHLMTFTIDELYDAWWYFVTKIDIIED